MNDIYKNLSKNKVTIDNIKYRPLDEEFADKIDKLYKTYDGKNEFLYRPSLDQINDIIDGEKSCYIGAINKEGDLIAIEKITKLGKVNDFFIIPKNEPQNADYYSLSNVLVLSDYRKHRIASNMASITMNALSSFDNTFGVFADCDYRNIASFKTLSKFANLIGVVDGRKGAIGEQTLYTTFYKPLKTVPEKNHLKDFEFNTIDSMDLSLDKIIDKLSSVGDISHHKVPYGEGYNVIYVLDTPVDTGKINIKFNDMNLNKSIFFINQEKAYVR